MFYFIKPHVLCCLAAFTDLYVILKPCLTLFTDFDGILYCIIDVLNRLTSFTDFYVILEPCLMVFGSVHLQNGSKKE